MKRQNQEKLGGNEISGWVLPSIEESLTLPAQELLSRLNTSLLGLSSEEAEERLRIYGYNEIVKKKKRIVIVDFLSHFKSPLIIILLVAGLISGFFGEVVNTIIIFQ